MISARESGGMQPSDGGPRDDGARQRELDVEVELDPGSGRDRDRDRETRTETERRAGRLGGVRARLGRAFSVRVLLLALALSTAGLVGARSVPLLGTLPVVGDVAGYVGVALAGFAVGVATDGRRYVETALAGALAAGLGAVSSALLLTVATDIGPAFAAVGAVGGAVAGLVGAYLGNDLRDGLTRPVE